MNKDLTVSPSFLRDSANELKSKVQTLRENLDSVTQESNQVPNYYTGSASDEFMAKYDEMKTKFNSFYTVIEEYSNFLIKTANAYEAVEEKLKKQADEYLA